MNFVYIRELSSYFLLWMGRGYDEFNPPYPPSWEEEERNKVYGKWYMGYGIRNMEYGLRYTFIPL